MRDIHVHNGANWFCCWCGGTVCQRCLAWHACSSLRSGVTGILLRKGGSVACGPARITPPWEHSSR